MRTIDFYYWGAQCPVISETLQLLDAWKFVYYIRYHDVIQEPDTAKEQRMYFPFLTVIDGKHRYFAPLNGDLLKELLTNEFVNQPPYCPQVSLERKDGIITPLTVETIPLIAKGCTLGNCKQAYLEKSKFLQQISENSRNTDIFGFLNLMKGETAGGAEFLPSLCVPYDIPKSEDAAFLTCSYYSSEKADYKIGPLMALENYLKGRYHKLIAITDENGVFPNGPLSWFLKYGYTDCGIILQEEEYCKLHLVEKCL